MRESCTYGSVQGRGVSPSLPRPDNGLLARIMHHTAFFTRPAAARAPTVRLVEWSGTTRGATRSWLICRGRAARRGTKPAAHGPDGIRRSAAARNNARFGQLVGSWMPTKRRSRRRKAAR